MWNTRAEQPLVASVYCLLHFILFYLIWFRFLSLYLILFHFILFYLFIFYWRRSSYSYVVWLLFKFQRFFKLQHDSGALIYTTSYTTNFIKVMRAPKMLMSIWTLMWLSKIDIPKYINRRVHTRTVVALKCRQTNNWLWWHELVKMKRLTRWMSSQSSSW